MSETLPPATARPCRECPFRRVSAPGWLGPGSVDDWLGLAHSDQPGACHLTVREDHSWVGASQCAGLATYRANVCKWVPDGVARGPVDREAVFTSPMEFRDHHTRMTRPPLRE